MRFADFTGELRQTPSRRPVSASQNLTSPSPFSWSPLAVTSSLPSGLKRMLQTWPSWCQGRATKLTGLDIPEKSFAVTAARSGPAVRAQRRRCHNLFAVGHDGPGHRGFASHALRLARMTNCKSSASAGASSQRPAEPQETQVPFVLFQMVQSAIQGEQGLVVPAGVQGSRLLQVPER